MAFFKIPGLAVGTAAAGIYCMIQNRQLCMTEYEIVFEKLPSVFSGKKILQLSDLHTKKYGDNYDNLINSCKTADPDYIFFTGDLYSRNEVNLDHKLVLMKRLRTIAPVYYVFGNHEADTPEKAEVLAIKLEQCGINVLRNKKIRLYSGEEYINVYGADIESKYYKNSKIKRMAANVRICTDIESKYYENSKGSYSNLPQLTVEKLDRMLGESDKYHFNILLAHTPFPFINYAKWGADLIFSGHCHGGVIRIPKIGGLLSPERKFLPEYTKGVYANDKNENSAKMVVSAGLGKFRLQNPSEIILVTLRSKDN